MAAEGPSGWVEIKADNYTATVSARTLLAQTDSHLAHLVEMALQSNPSNPELRLDISAEEAKEMVAALRQGPAYKLPHERRLRDAVTRLFDKYGVQLQPAAGQQPFLLVPTYDLWGTVEYPNKYGLLQFSGAIGGWANMAGADDPRPDFLKFNPVEEAEGAMCLASVISAEYTGIGEDVIYFVNGGVANLNNATGLTAATMKTVPCKTPPGEFALICDASLTSAKGNLYMLGGETLIGPPYAVTPLRIYEPRQDSWFEAEPPSSTEQLTNSALVTNKPEGLLLSIGGYAASANDLEDEEAGRNAPMSDRVAMHDLHSKRWTNSPSGCKWPGAAETGPRYPTACRPSLSATAYDEYSIMVVAGVKGEQARVDVLDLRTWRWREGIAQLQRSGKDSRGVSVVAYEGKVVAIGGRATGTVGDEGEDFEQQQQQQQQEEEGEGEWSVTKTGVREVYSYDPAANAWSKDAFCAAAVWCEQSLPCGGARGCVRCL